MKPFEILLEESANAHRHLCPGQPLKPLKPNEKTWIEKVIKAIILRVGEYAYDPDAKFKKITMSEFPNI
jgi:hypothetical protein